jgi:hypothetical protein
VDESARYYHDCLVNAFPYTRAWAHHTGRVAEDVARHAQFQAVVAQCAPGAFSAARQVGEMAKVHLDTAPHPGPWWRDLVEYEFACFLQTATTEPAVRTRRHTRGSSALSEVFGWKMQELIEHLRAGQPIGDDLRGECMLLFSRARQGSAVVVELDRASAAVFRSTNGFRTPEQIAVAAGVSVELATALLEQFVEIGAVEEAISNKQ